MGAFTAVRNGRDVLALSHLAMLQFTAAQFIYLFIYLFIIHETDAQWAKNVNKRYKIKQYINHRFIGSCRAN